jgi:hypothetical protein
LSNSGLVTTPNIFGEIPKWLSELSGSNQIVIILLFDNLTEVGISSAGPSARLTVEVPLNIVELVPDSDDGFNNTKSVSV